MRAWLLLLVVVLVTATLTRWLPFSAFFRNVDTLIHEMAHALATLLLSGRVMHIHLYADQSGITASQFAESWMLLPIALAGYPGSALFAWLLFRLHASGKERTGLWIVAILAAIALLLFVRNSYGILWAGGFAVLTAVLALFAPRWLQIGYYLLVAFICLVESIFSSFTILALSVLDPLASGDATILSRATALPPFVFGIIFMVFALWCAKRSTALLLARYTKPSAAQMPQHYVPSSRHGQGM